MKLIELINRINCSTASGRIGYKLNYQASSKLDIYCGIQGSVLVSAEVK